MDNPAAHSPAAPDAGPRQRSVELRRAAIEVDSSAIQRTAQFTDGSTRSVRLEWNGITRVLALKCEQTHGELLCMIVTGGGNVVVLHEEMDGFRNMVDALPAHLAGAPAAAEWRHRVMRPAPEANVTRLFARQTE
ncbi:MAG TPA: hypothetical protein VG267_12425 [Terracidiphilus sp.]|jgi:hypothetical protein|nr:hypothetical protein [Terracidiphilus sp.]